MFILVTGKPKSGKSYYAVDYISKHKNKYHNVYVNINGFKFKDNFKPFNYNDFYKIASDCKNIHDLEIASLGDNAEQNVIDQPILDYLLDIGFIVPNPKYEIYLKELEVRKNKNSLVRSFLDTFFPVYSEPEYRSTLFIIDEAHNHFPSTDSNTGKSAGVDPVLLWLISYHAHLYMDVILLSQHKDKIHSLYLKDIEYFIDAVPQSQTVLPWYFVYKHYVKSTYYKVDMAKKIKIKKSNKVFELYQAGDRIRTKSVVLPWFIGSLVGLGVVIAIFDYIGSSMSTSVPDKKVHSSVNIVPTSHFTNDIGSSSVFSYVDLKYVSLMCLGKYCKNYDYNIVLNIRDLKDLLKGTHSKFIRQDVVNPSLALSKVYLLVSSDFLELFQNRSIDNEENFNLLSR